MQDVVEPMKFGICSIKSQEIILLLGQESDLHQTKAHLFRALIYFYLECIWIFSFMGVEVVNPTDSSTIIAVSGKWRERRAYFCSPAICLVVSYPLPRQLSKYLSNIGAGNRTKMSEPTHLERTAHEPRDPVSQNTRPDLLPS